MSTKRNEVEGTIIAWSIWQCPKKCKIAVAPERIYEERSPIFKKGGDQAEASGGFTCAFCGSKLVKIREISPKASV